MNEALQTDPSDSVRNFFFIDPVLQPAGEPRTVVRKGDKWLGAEGEEVSIRRTDEEDVEIARARITDTRLYTLALVPEEDLLLGYDDLCRTRLGLGIVMGRAYPDIKPHDDVTVVRFEVLDEG